MTDSDDDIDTMPAWRARLYLDVDGVLSPLPHPQRLDPVWPPATWPTWVDPRAFTSTPFPVAVLDDLTLIAADANIEIVWATTWPADMIHNALAEVGYPQLRFRHLNPDGHIDKTTAIRDDVRAAPLPFVWIDDSRWPGDLNWRSPAPRLRLTPKPTVGLTPAMWTRARDWLNAHSR